MTGEIYALHLDDGIFRYIGKTQYGAAKRLESHLKEAIRGKLQYPVYHWIRKHGIENIRMTVLETTDSLDELNILEKKHIAEIRKTGLALNITDGGDGHTALHTQDTKDQISQSMLGNGNGIGWVPTMEQRERIANSPHRRERISQALKGRPTKGPHTRFHTNRGIANPECVYCIE